MARFESTLYQPDSKVEDARSPRGAGSGTRRRDDDEDEGPSIALGAILGEAVRSARRRLGLSFVVMMICSLLTVVGAICAPRTYEVESRVLVQQGNTAVGAAQVRPEDMQSLAREYEEQIKARDNILAIVKQKNLVARWDEMRQPHRRVIDKVNHELGKAGPTDAEKSEALVANIEQRMKVFVDATTVTIKLEWSHADAAREIVDAAVKNFLETRFQSEVGVLPAQLKMKETFVAQAQKNVEAAALDLARFQNASPRNARKGAAAPAHDVAVGAPKSAQEAQVRFDTATASLQTLVKQREELRVRMLEQEAQYKNRYKVTHPAEVPAAPKRPVTSIAIVTGILSTIAAVLAIAALADRFSGIFYEPREVRDRIGLPVLAAFS